MSSLKPLGPQAMLARIEQMRAQVAPPSTSAPPVTTTTTEFQAPMDAALSGSITSEGSYAPMNPFGNGANIKSTLTPEMLKPMIERAATQHGLEPSLLDALVQAESNYNPAAVSSKRAVGLTQLMPDTARGLGVTDPFDPAQNLQGGAKYLAQMLKQFDGDMTKAVAAYNAGPGAVTKHGGIPPFRETRNYVEKVLSLYRAKRAG